MMVNVVGPIVLPLSKSCLSALLVAIVLFSLSVIAFSGAFMPRALRNGETAKVCVLSWVNNVLYTIRWRDWGGMNEGLEQHA